MNGNPDYTDDDLKILLSGSWEAEPEQEPEPEPAPQPEPAPEETSPVAPQPVTKPTKATPQVAASAHELNRVELQPGGVKAAIEAILAVADVPVSVR